MEISLTLNNELIFDREFSSKDIFKAVSKGVVVSLIILIGAYCSRQLLLSKDFIEGINGTYPEFLNTIYDELFSIPEEYMNRSIGQDLKAWFGIDAESLSYIGSKSLEAIKNTLKR